MVFIDDVVVEDDDRTCELSGKGMGAWNSSDGMLCVMTLRLREEYCLLISR